MNYKVLYRKYRPSNFDELVGQDSIKNILKNSIINDKIAHAYIFTGPRGTGKTSTAKIFARTLNCLESNNGISCGKCSNCINFNSNPDIIEMDAASNNGVDNIRDIIEGVTIAPSNGKYKIYIIDEVHMLSTGAWNAFLKTLEEPPSNVIFILATTDIQKVPITVLSRCQRFDFSRIDRKLISENLISVCDNEGISYDRDTIDEISYLSDGCMRDALSILDQLSKVSDMINMDVLKANYGTVTNTEIENLYSFIIRNDLDMLIKSIADIKETGVDIKIFINKMLEVLISKAVLMKKKAVSNKAFNQIKKIIESLNVLLNKINANSNGYLLLELELVSFINDDDFRLSNREVSQIISREIIQVDTKIDINNMLNSDNNQQIYNICDQFINIRVNNCFVNCSKKSKSDLSSLWQDYTKQVMESNRIEFKTVVGNSSIQVASDKYALLVTSSESFKIVANSKLYDLELDFNSKENVDYKFIFISRNDWNDIMKNFDKNKVYSYMDETEYINNSSSSVSLAEEIFGSEKINLD